MERLAPILTADTSAPLESTPCTSFNLIRSGIYIRRYLQSNRRVYVLRHPSYLADVGASKPEYLSPIFNLRKLAQE
jgi:hypothetical protein